MSAEENCILLVSHAAPGKPSCVCFAMYLSCHKLYQIILEIIVKSDVDGKTVSQKFPPSLPDI
jgi:hypothetical protein